MDIKNLWNYNASQSYQNKLKRMHVIAMLPIATLASLATRQQVHTSSLVQPSNYHPGNAGFPGNRADRHISTTARHTPPAQGGTHNGKRAARQNGSCYLRMFFRCNLNTRSSVIVIIRPILLLGLKGVCWVVKSVSLELGENFWCHEMETLSILLSLCEENPLVTGGFPSQMATIVEFWSESEQAVDQTVEW